MTSLLVLSPEEGMVQAFFCFGSALWLISDHPLDEILCHHIVNMFQIVLTFFDFSFKFTPGSREDMRNQKSCHLKSNKLLNLPNHPLTFSNKHNKLYITV